MITPYVGQLRHLEMELRRLGIRRNDLLLNTVDAFQGKECEVVVISSVRSNQRGAVGFLKDARRLNVALTRGRRGLVVVGHPQTLSHVRSLPLP